MSFPSFRSGIRCNLDVVSISLILFSFAFILVIFFFLTVSWKNTAEALHNKEKKVDVNEGRILPQICSRPSAQPR
jgi:hypothetical protein